MLDRKLRFVCADNHCCFIPYYILRLSEAYIEQRTIIAEPLDIDHGNEMNNGMFLLEKRTPDRFYLDNDGYIVQVIRRHPTQLLEHPRWLYHMGIHSLAMLTFSES